jgi:hypothetical protein
MKSRILSDDRDLAYFAERFKERGNDVQLNYLKQSQIRAFFDAQGTMFAGYARNIRRPLRYEMWIPEKQRGAIPLLRSRKHLCELTCIWIAGKQGSISSEIIYLYSVIDALLSGADFILGGTLSPVVFGIQTQSLPSMLYSGHTDYFGKRKKCWIYGASRRLLCIKLITLFPINIIKGMFGRSSYLARAKRMAREVKEVRQGQESHDAGVLHVR